MIQFLISLFVGLLLFTLTPSVLAGSNTPAQPAWMTEAVVRDLLEMNLSDSQRLLLQQALGTCLTDIQADVHKITKRGGFDQESKIKRKNKYHWRTFEETMLPTLSEQQITIFERYLQNQIQAVGVNLKPNEPLHSIRSD